MRSKPSTRKLSKHASLGQLVAWSRVRAIGQQGLTQIELLVGTIIALIVLGITFSGAIANRNLVVEDQTRQSVNQNLRSGLDILGADIQQVGEGLGTVRNFPALQVTNSGDGQSSEIIIRRRPLVALQVCQAITAGTSDPVVVAIYGSTTAGCAPTSDPDGDGWPDSDIELWRNYRLDAGTTVRAYIFDGRNQGEIFDYISEDRLPNNTNPGSAYRINRGAGAWLNSYAVGTMVFLVEERRYRLCPPDQLSNPNCRADPGRNNILQLIVNGDLTNPTSLIDGVDQFDIQVRSRDVSAAPTVTPTQSVDYCWQGAARNNPISAPPGTCADAESWARVLSVDVRLRGVNPAASDLVRTKNNESSRTVAESFFPRNVLSF